MKMMFCDVVEEEATRNYNNAVKTAETRGREEGRAEGREEGRAEGRAEGREEGRAEGRAEGREEGRAEGEKKAKIESAKRFLSMGLSVEQVAAGTGLSLEEIEKLK